ncbi:methyl-accepting chemotaxis protein [Agathobacter ruminis]|uniref:Methyl-accepting chemotaxis protein n=1 Tax=Agathobacter ruminis TaxID=1712665 RepID=A0A2G3E595_9FIRM|nr:methyl-accepting chemotaxis protein [Agathobacter ruminis]MDC7301401.1 methyl-accepting chemotaxis protein [Agathobacter ruminis]PHU38243.1 methyl-accepting chemotaxis protein [Agathobacter ruminis]
MNKTMSIKIKIMVPVLLLGIVSIFSNIMSVYSLRSVNKTASTIADEYMTTITELDTIGQTAKSIHTHALSHIVATDFETMKAIVDEIEAEEATLAEALDTIKGYDNEAIASSYESMLADFKSFEDSVKILLAQSANQKTKDAYATANGSVAEQAKLLNGDIEKAIDDIKQDSADQRAALSRNYRVATIASYVVIIISVLAVLIAVFMVLRYVIRPVIKAESELRDIIDGINRREGDLTKRVSVQSQDEIGALSAGINAFIEHLQTIFTMITNNSEAMDRVVKDVLSSVQTSNGSASDLSSLTEELSATMQEVANSAGVINQNTEAVRAEVEDMAERSREINEYSKEMKEHANNMEVTAKSNMEQTNAKVDQILESLNQAIAESQSVDQVNSLTDDIMNIASQTNLLSLNASIEAARAGEAGKGFAVVAGEIGSLAENSRQTAGNIQAINSVVVNAVHNLADSANELVDYMKNSILPEFARFVEDGEKYRNNADYIESVMADFSNKTEGFKETFNEIASSISSITSAIDDGVQGVSSAAESTQTLVYDMDNISHRMDENQRIAGELDNETAIFKKI